MTIRRIIARRYRVGICVCPWPDHVSEHGVTRCYICGLSIQRPANARRVSRQSNQCRRTPKRGTEE